MSLRTALPVLHLRRWVLTLACPLLGAVALTTCTGEPTAPTVDLSGKSLKNGDMTIVSGDGQSGIAGTQLALPLTVLVNKGKNAAKNVLVTFTVTAGGGQLQPQSVKTNNQGLASAQLTLGPLVGANSIEVSVPDVPPVTFTATGTAGPPATVVVVSGDGQSGTVGQSLALPVVVRVEDVKGNVVSGTAVTFTVTAGGGALSPSGAVTDPTGQASATWTLGTVSGLHTAQVSAGPARAASVSATGVAGSPAAIAIASGDGQVGVAGSALASPIVARVTDADDNPVAGVSVDFVAATGGGSVTPVTATTDAAGNASATWTLGTTAGANTASATAAGLPPVGFTATGIAGTTAQLVLVSGGNQSAQYLAALPAPMVIKAVDANGNGVAGVTVDFAATSGGGSFAPASVVTGSDGLASVVWTLGPAPGPNTAQATAAGLPTLQLLATATSGPAAAMDIVSATPQVALVSTAVQDPLRVQVRDANQFPVPGVTVTFTILVGGGTLGTPSAVTDANGFAATSWVVGPQPNLGDAEVQAGLPGVPSVTFQAYIAPRLELQSGDGQTGASGVTLASPIVARVVDGQGTPVASIPVQFEVITGAGSVSLAQVLSNSSGQAASMWTLGDLPGAQVVQAHFPDPFGLPVPPDWPLVTFTATAVPIGPPASLVVASGNNQSAAPGQQLGQPLEIQVRDANGFGVSDVTVDFAVMTGGGFISPASALTDNSGRAQAIWTLGAAPGAQTVEATAAGLGPLTFTALAASYQLLGQGDQQTQVAGTTLVEPIGVLVEDILTGQPMANIPVTFTVLAGGGMPTDAMVLSDDRGLALTSFTLGPAAGANLVEVSADGAAPVQLSFTGVGAGAYAVWAAWGDGETGIIGLPLSQPLVAVAVDFSGNPVPGVTVDFRVISGTGTLGATSVVTDGAGQANTTLTLGPNVELVQVEASVAGVGNPAIFNVTASMPGPVAMWITSSDPQVALVGMPVPQPLTARVVDALGHGVSGIDVNFSIQSGGGSLSSAMATTGANGDASTGWTVGPTPTLGRVDAVVTGLSPVSFNVYVVPRLELVSGDGQAGVEGQPLPAPLVVRATDGLGQPVARIPIGFTTPDGGVFLPSVSRTDDAGFAGSTWALGYALGTQTAQAQLAASLPSGAPIVTFTAAAVSLGPPAALVIVAGNGQSAGPGQMVPAPLQLRVTDANGFGVPGADVTLAVTSGGGSLSETNPVTAENGMVYVYWTLGPTLGQQTVEATAAGLGPVTLTALAASYRLNGYGDGQTQVAGTTLAQPIGALVEDILTGQPMANVPVTLTVLAGGGSPATTTMQSDDQGLALTGFTLGPTAGTNLVELSAAGAAPVQLAFTAVAAGAYEVVILAGEGQTGIVGLPLSQPLVVVVVDFDRNPVPGATVDFRVIAGTGTLGATSAVTDDGGVASTTLTLGPNIETVQVEAAVAGLPNTAVFSEMASAPGPVAVWGVGGDQQLVLVGTAAPQPLTVRVVDVLGMGVSGIDVSFNIQNGGGTLGSTTGSTDANGEASTTWTVGPTPGLGHVVADVPGLGSYTFTSYLVPNIAILGGDGQVGAVGAPLPQLIQALVTDGNAQPVVGLPVDFYLGDESDGYANPNRDWTDANGVASTTWVLGTTPGSQTLIAGSALPLPPGAPTLTFTATAVPAGPPAAIAIVSGDGATAPAGSAVGNLVVSVTDGQGLPVSGVDVAFQVTTGGGTVSQGSVQTDPSGLAATVWTLGDAAGAQTVTASVSGLTAVTFTATALVAARLDIVSGEGQTAEVGQMIQVVVQAFDGNDQPFAGAPVSFAVTGGAGTISAGRELTDVDGTAVVLWTMGPQTGAQTLEASVPGVSPVVVTAQAVAGPAAQLLVVSGDGQTAQYGTTLPAPVVVMVADAYGAGVAGVPVDFTLYGGAGSVSPPTAVTDAGGLASTAWTLGPAPNDYYLNIVARPAGLPVLYTSASAIATAGPAAAIAINYGDGQIDQVGNMLQYPLEVVVTDAGGFAVDGAQVDFTPGAGSGVVSPASAPTSNGFATTQWTLGTTAGTQTVTASINGGAVSVTFTASALPAPPAVLSVISGDGQSAPEGTALTDPVVVSVTDQYGNPLGGVLVYFTVTAGGGYVSPASSWTDASGQAQVGWVLGTAGGQSLDVSVSGMSGSGVTVTATAVAPSPIVSSGAGL